MTNEQSNFLAELAALADEVKQDQINAIPAKEKKLHEVAYKLLQLERDLAVPGADSSAAARQIRIMDMIQDEDF
jgi:hypothetical protein